MKLNEVLELTREQEEFLFAGLNWWGLVKIVNREGDGKSKWDQLRMMIGSGDG